MQQRYINNYLSINLLRLILFSLLCFLQFINCQDCPTSTPDINNPNFGESFCHFSVVKNKWFTCVTSTDSGEDKTYFANNTEGNCVFTKYWGFYNVKTVYGTNECIKSCAIINDTLKGKFVDYEDYCIYSSNDQNLFGMSTAPSSDDPDYDLIDNNGYRILKCNKV